MDRIAAEQHNTIIIRDARLSDAAAIARVRVAAWRAAYRDLIPDSYLDRPDFQRLEALHLHAAIRDLPGTAHISVAELRRQLAGYCAYGASGAAREQPALGALYDLFVDPGAWRCGVGRALLSSAIQHLRVQGFARACLFVYEANTRARAFYERAGWKADGHRAIDQRPEFALAVLRYQKVLADSVALGQRG